MEQIEHHLNSTEVTTDAAFQFLQKFRTIATGTIDYSKQSLSDSAAFFEKLSGAKSIDTALKIQSDYAKESYEAFMAQARKVGSLYSDLGKEAFKPIAAVNAKVQSDRN
jgi:hypothetical protein